MIRVLRAVRPSRLSLAVTTATKRRGERRQPALLADREQGRVGDRLRIGRGGALGARAQQQRRARRRAARRASGGSQDRPASSGGERPSSRPRSRTRPRALEIDADGRAPSGRPPGGAADRRPRYMRLDHRRDPPLPCARAAPRICLSRIRRWAIRRADMAVRLRRPPGRARDNRRGRRAPSSRSRLCHIVGHVAVGRRDHGGRPAHDMVAGEQGARLRRARSRDGWRCGRASPPPRASSPRPSSRLAVGEHAVRRDSRNRRRRRRAGPSSSSASGAQPMIGAPVAAASGAAGRAVVAMGVGAEDRGDPLARASRRGSRRHGRAGRGRDRSPPPRRAPTI